MRHILFAIFFFVMVLNFGVYSQHKSVLHFKWEKIASLQDLNGRDSIGLAGAISAVLDNSLVIAGGANFPDKMPWEGGKKHYSDEIHVLQNEDNSYKWNKNIKARLPMPIAYCGNTSTPKGILYAGGENQFGLSKKVFLINFSDAKDEILVSTLPDLPLVLTNISLCAIGNIVYAVGGDGLDFSSKTLLSLNLDDLKSGWRSLADLPFALANSSTVVLEDGEGKKIFVFGGRSKNPSGISKLNNSLLIYSPKSNIWKHGAKIINGSAPMNFSAGAVFPISKHNILIAGGDDGLVFNQIETYLSKISAASSEEEKTDLTAKKNELVINHKGFNRSMLLYDTLSDSWTKIGELPFPAHVTTSVVKWGENLVLPSGEIRPGIRTPYIMLGKPVNKN